MNKKQLRRIIFSLLAVAVMLSLFAATALAEGECRVYTDDGVRKAHCTGGMLSCTKEITRLFSTDFAWKE